MKKNIFLLSTLALALAVASCLPLQAAFGPCPAPAEAVAEERILRFNWLEQFGQIKEAEILERATEEEWNAYVTNRVKRCVVKLYAGDILKLEFAFRDNLGIAADKTYKLQAGARSLQETLEYADKKMAEALEKTEAANVAAAFPGYHHHSLALRTLVAYAEEKLNGTYSEKALREYITPLRHLIAEADEHGGMITNTIDKLLYLIVISCLSRL